ncbi:MAG: hypothetical protein E7242_10070 [Lachnospiraceae bacterium]|nr:hypothetical protein [Lachnospiraceae bacterium]
MNKLTKCISGGVACACAVVGMSAGVLASNPDAEIPSAGVAQALNSYFWESQSIESDLLALVTPSVASSQSTAAEDSIYNSIAISVCDDNVNVRSGPSTDYDVVGVISNHCAASIIGVEGDWYHIQSGNVEGYILSSYFVVGAEAESLANQIGFIKATVNDGTGVLNVRTEPNTSSEVISSIFDGEAYSVVEESGNWVKVNFEGFEGWISSDYVSIGLKYDTAKTFEELQAEEEARIAATTATVSSYSEDRYETYHSIASASSYDGSLGERICAYASQFVGWLPYVYGGNSLETGTDCSGFTSLVFAQFGIGLSRSSDAQAGNGYSVPLSDAMPGDIIVYGGHVALYIGGGMIIDEPVPGAVCSCRSMYIMPIQDVRRVL